MLVLTRKVGESLVIDGKIVVRILGGQSGRIRVGVEAPPELAIRRAELAPNSRASIEVPLVSEPGR